MNNRVTTPICLKQINSYQKLRFLLFLHQSPEFEGTSHAFAERLHLGDTQLVEQIITELQDRGLIECLGNCYRLNDDPEVKSFLRGLATTFEDPLARQKLLDQVWYAG